MKLPLLFLVAVIAVALLADLHVAPFDAIAHAAIGWSNTAENR